MGLFAAAELVKNIGGPKGKENTKVNEIQKKSAVKKKDDEFGLAYGMEFQKVVSVLRVFIASSTRSYGYHDWLKTRYGRTGTITTLSVGLMDTYKMQFFVKTQRCTSDQRVKPYWLSTVKN